MSDRAYKLQNYPLSWPDDWKRTPAHQQKRAIFSSGGYDLSVNGGVNRILQQLSSMGIKRDDVLISTNMETRIDGLPRSDAKVPRDPGVAVYWRKNSNAPMQCMAIDIYTTVAGNLGAVAATLQAMRAIERHGGSQIQERTFRGFAALPARTGTAWRDVMRFSGDARVTTDQIELRYKVLAKEMHPDSPRGSHDAMAALNSARQQALKEIEAL